MRARHVLTTRHVRIAGIFVAGMLAVVGSRPGLGQDPNRRINDSRSASPSTSIVRSEGKHRLAADIERVIGWLPEDTESVILARGPFHPRPRIEDDPRTRRVSHTEYENGKPITVEYYQPPANASPPLPRDFQQLSLDHYTRYFDSAGKAFRKNIERHGIRFVISAARRFGSIDRIPGASPFEGCQLIFFEGAVADVAVQPDAPLPVITGGPPPGLKPVTPDTVAVEEIEGNRVIRVDTRTDWGGNKKLSLHIAKPRPNVLIAANDFGFLRTMLQRMARAAASRSLLLDFVEWQYLDTKLPVWGIHHHSTNVPFEIPSGGNDHSSASPKFQGISFSYQPQPAPNVTFRCHCAEKPANVLTAIFGTNANIQQIGPSVAATQVQIHPEPNDIKVPKVRGKPTAADMQFYILNLMGYVICP